MKLALWIDKELAGKSRKYNYKSEVIAELSKKSGVSTVTIENASRGLLLTRYDKAKALSEATGGKVSVEDLCE